MSSEITAEMIEDVFGKHSDSVRFANFCNAVVMAESSASATTIPILSEKPGADGGMDAEWTITADASSDFKSPFGLPGWNVFQFKARSIAGDGRARTFSSLCNDLKGARAKLIGRLSQPKECRQYSFFTNLQLGLETATKTRDEKLLQQQRTQLANAIAEGEAGQTSVKIFDAAQLAAIVNAHPALRLTYFSGPVARSWNDAWEAEQRIKDYKVSVPFVGRNQELSRIVEWLKDANTKVIVLCGPSGMGKTRLALEATRLFALSTTIVEAVDELLRTDFQAFGTSKTTRFIIVEDPTCDQAEALAKRAVACAGVKLILTVPTDAKAPTPKLTEHEAIKTLPPLQPLNNSDAESLLKAAGASFDSQARDWVLLQAGGNPEILLSAAELQIQGGLREKSGDLKKRLHERFRAKIEKVLGLDGLRALKVLSPVLYVKFQGEDSELKLVCDALGLGIQPSRILELWSDLERMGYIRRRGNYLSVVPPLFAARLVEELASTQEDSMRILFNALGKASRDRFLERMVTVDLPETSTFWEFVFAENGPVEVSHQTSGYFDHIDCLARAIPARTARFLETKLLGESNSSWKAYGLTSTLRELAYEGESCAPGMRCLELLALKEIDETKQLKESHVFCECFVDWYHHFPMSYQERASWIERLLKSENRARRLLGTHVVAFVTAPPQSLSGYSVTARRLGQSPPIRLWRDIFDYVARLVEIRFELTQSEDEEIAKIAQSKFDEALSQLMGHVSPDQLVTIMEKFVECSFNKKLTSDERKVRSAIHWVEDRYTESSKNPGQKEFHDKWAAILQRLAVLRERYDNGNFALRLKIATGNHSFDTEWEEGEQGRVYRYQKRLRSLASEVALNPTLMTDDVWGAIKDANSHLAGEFLGFLGECDSQKHFITQFETEAIDHAGKWRFGLYCSGLYRSDTAFTENYLERLTQNPSFDKGALLLPIALIGSTQTNRKRLIQFIADKSVTPVDVTNMFRAGRWLEGVPISEIVIIMEYMAQGNNWPQAVADVMSLYLHLNKPLPDELIPLGERTLQEINSNLDESYHCNQIAIGISKTDLEKGFALFEKCVSVLNNVDWRVSASGWNPLHTYGRHEFWDYLRSQDAERAYRCFCTLKNRHVRNEILDNDNKTLLDLANHSSILLKIANENEEDAERIAASISIKQPGFFPFAFELLSNRPVDGKVASCLSSTIVERFGFGSGEDKLQTALSDVESEIKKIDVPNHGRAWLEKLKHRIQEAIKASPWNRGENEYLGWS
ncbi:MAG TPA: hypothetical protein VGN23_13270 [Verrucomicrobiae bacterium]|jgi:hypothetical protein